jgi:peptide/nickel transport system permease protein
VSDPPDPPAAPSPRVRGASDPSEPESDPLLLARLSRKSRVAGAQPRRGPTPVPPSTPGARVVAWANPGALSRRLGLGGLLVAALLVLLAIFADLFASDLPIVVKLHGKVFVLPNVTRPPELAELDRGLIEREADWSLRPLVRHGLEVAPGETRAALLPPGGAHLLGTDRQGRDVMARVIHGTRGYLVFALAAVLASVALGALLGGIAGLFGGAVDAVVSRIIESVSAFPPLVLVIGVQAAVSRPSMLTLFLAIALTRWPEVARLVRGEVILASTQDYVIAARALGASPFRVLRRHIAPNVRAPLVVASAAGVSAVVLTEASLDFLRVGTPEGAPSWGETMSQFRDAPSAWWLLAFPGVLLVVTVIAYNLMGEALRSALDHRSR